MNKRIVMEPSGNIRRLARQMLAGHWGTAILAILITEVVQRVPIMVIGRLFPSGAVIGIENLYSLLVGAPLAMGLAIVLLKIARNRQTAPMEVFYGFEYLGKAILLQLVMGLFIFLWTLLLIIPGIMAAYSYRYAFYILADDPRKGIMQCLNESKYLTRGNRGQMFILDVSFIGWDLLCGIPVFLFTFTYGMMNIDTLMQINATTQYELTQAMMNLPGMSLGTQIAQLGFVVLGAYTAMAGICMYDLMNGNLIIQRAPAGAPGMGGQPYQQGFPNMGGQGYPNQQGTAGYQGYQSYQGYQDYQGGVPGQTPGAGGDSAGGTHFEAHYPVEAEAAVVKEEDPQQAQAAPVQTQEAPQGQDASSQAPAPQGQDAPVQDSAPQDQEQQN